MCACVRITASAATASGGRREFRARDSSRRPWYIPQSTSSVPALVSTRCIDPVTSCAAPRKRTVVAIDRSYYARLVRSYRLPKRAYGAHLPQMTQLSFALPKPQQSPM